MRWPAASHAASLPEPSVKVAEVMTTPCAGFATASTNGLVGSS